MHHVKYVRCQCLGFRDSHLNDTFHLVLFFSKTCWLRTMLQLQVQRRLHSAHWWYVVVMGDYVIHGGRHVCCCFAVLTTVIVNKQLVLQQELFPPPSHLSCLLLLWEPTWQISQPSRFREEKLLSIWLMAPQFPHWLGAVCKLQY